jgi:hypothetical protein
MKYFILLILTFSFLSCKKVEIKPQEPLGPQPIITDTTFVDSTVSLKNTTWVIKKVLNTNFDQEFRSDTIVFLTNNIYTFNGNQSTYNFYPNNLNYTLTLNNTPWGHISAGIYEYNITQGEIINCQFNNYFSGQNVVKVWMYKI